MKVLGIALLTLVLVVPVAQAGVVASVLKALDPDGEGNLEELLPTDPSEIFVTPPWVYCVEESTGQYTGWMNSQDPDNVVEDVESVRNGGSPEHALEIMQHSKEYLYEVLECVGLTGIYALCGPFPAYGAVEWLDTKPDTGHLINDHRMGIFIPYQDANTELFSQQMQLKIDGNLGATCG